MRIAAIDVGTNTAMLLVAEVAAGGVLVPVFEAQRFIRLGEGVDATQRVTAPAMQRLRAALLEYQALARDHDAEAVVVGATSASRDAQNQAELIDFVRRETGLRFEILSGLEEAILSFRGALSAIQGLDGRCAVIDIGGGSTEIVVGQAGGGLSACHSLDVGSVRLTERFFADQPPTPEAVGRAEAFITGALDEAALPLDASIPLIAAAETPLLVALLDRGASSWDDLGVSTVMLSADVVHGWRERLLALPYDAVLALHPALMTGRADVAPAAVLLLDTVLRYFGLPQCRVSPRSLRHGLALHHAARLDITRRAFDVFYDDADAAPPMTLRGGNAVDSYYVPLPYDPQHDAPTDAYIAHYAYWGVAHLDPVSWRHYLPRLIDYALRHAEDAGSLEVEALLWSLRSPDREPPRLGSLSKEQEAVVVSFLDVLAFDERSAWQDFAMLVLEEYWTPGALYRKQP